MCRPGEYEPKLGDYLGMCTNEIDLKKGNYITEVVALAPKSYAYKTDKDYSHALVKGIAFNHITKLHVNLDVMKDMVLVDNEKQIEVDQLKFVRNKKDWSMHVEETKKKISYTFNKRVVQENKYETLPYGF